ncbi:MAG: CPBP family intramembrane metalloprotease [Saprospiraceae bacterium]|nr:CPBP family intramembrane metalloprotease [Bacteroidia bacterium]NNL92455.1 CPBP family intramembrane metalloprotease [Saprospiraceae bacterium]
MRLEDSIKDFYRFLCDPIFNYKSDQPESYRNITIMFLLLFVFEMVVASVAFSFMEIDDGAHKMTEMLDQFAMWQIFILAVIIAPLFEEIFFRGYLRWPALFLGLVIGCLSALSIYYHVEGRLSVISSGILILFNIIAFAYFISSEQAFQKLVKFFKQYFGIIFYGSVVIFAFIHIFNFNEIQAWYLVPLMVLPQFILALFLGYVRVRNDLWASIYVHAFNNMIPMALLFLVPEGAI